MDVQPVPPDAANDDSLVRDVRRGSPTAFGAMMRRYNRRLYRTARAILKDDSLAEDALQEAYLAAFRHMDEFRGDAALGTWCLLGLFFGASSCRSMSRMHSTRR